MTAHSLVVVLDGLRPDYVDPELMPTLCALREEGVVARNHHAAYPSKTRVQSATIATGCFPGRHGLVGNSLRLPGVRDGPIDTADAGALLSADRETGGELLTVPSLGEVLADHGRTVFAAGSSTPGANLLANHRQAGAGVVNARGLVTEGRAEAVEDAIGPPPDVSVPNDEQNRWAFDAYLEVGLDGSVPDVSLVWISDPDISMHQYGVGHPRVLEAVEQLDAELGRVLDGLERRDLRRRTNVFVLADHGFSTDGGELDVAGTLEREGLGDLTTVVGDTQVYVHDGARKRVARSLRRADGVGAVLTRRRSGSAVPGTLPLDSVRLDHARTADVVVVPDWSGESNAHGYPGTTSRPGVGGHGTLSPYEMCPPLVAAGPDLGGGGHRSDIPTGHVDLAPTLLSLQGVSPPDAMQGRTLHELLRSGPGPDAISTETSAVAAGGPDGAGDGVVLERAHAGGVTYPEAIRRRRDHG